MADDIQTDDRPKGADGQPKRESHGVPCRGCGHLTWNGSARCDRCIALAASEVHDLGAWARRASAAKAELDLAQRQVDRLSRLADRVVAHRAVALRRLQAARFALDDVTAEQVAG